MDCLFLNSLDSKILTDNINYRYVLFSACLTVDDSTSYEDTESLLPRQKAGCSLQTAMTIRQTTTCSTVFEKSPLQLSLVAKDTKWL